MTAKTHTIDSCRGFSESGCPHGLYSNASLVDRLEQVVVDSGWPAFLNDVFRGKQHRHHAFSIRVSACPNGCARPHIADFGLIRACAPAVDASACTGCGECAEACPDDAIDMVDGLAVIDPAACVRCGICVRRCPFEAMACAETGWRILVGGRLGRHPKLAEELDGLYSTDEALAVLGRALKLYMDKYDKRVRFGALLDRVGLQALEAGN